MTEATELQILQAEIAELKAQKQAEAQTADAQRELDDLKAGRVPVTSAGNYAIAGEQIKDIKLAQVRQGMNGLFHFLLAPVASIYYGSKTGYWMPTLAATGVAVVALPFAVADLGLTFAVAPPLTSCLMMCNRSSEKRRQLGILMPEQADALMAKVTRF